MQDHRYINRELETLKLLKHPNTTRLAFYYYTHNGTDEEDNSKKGPSESDSLGKDREKDNYGRRGTIRKLGNNKQNDDKYLNLLLEYMPETLYRYTRRFVKSGTLPPRIEQKIIMWQFMRGVAYMH